jgi:hypothetical protein
MKRKAAARRASRAGFYEEEEHEAVFSRSPTIPKAAEEEEK